ncbi:MAG: starch-binding protein, partial [Ruminococcus sp.]
MKSFRKLTSILLAVLILASVISVAGVSVSAASGDVVYFDNSVTKWSEVYCYTWDGGNNNGEWPGQKMTNVGGDIWSYTMPMDGKEIIFNKGSNEAQSDNLAFQGNNMIAKPNSTNNKFDVTWSQYSGGGDVPTQPATVPATGSANGNYVLVCDNGDLGNFTNGTVTCDFSDTTYVWVRNVDTGVQYCTDGWQGFVQSVTLVNENATSKFDKLAVTAGTQTLTLVDNGNDTFTLSYGDAPTPTQAPTQEPTQEPTEAPTQAPTQEPTEAPTTAPVVTDPPATTATVTTPVGDKLVVSASSNLNTAAQSSEVGSKTVTVTYDIKAPEKISDCQAILTYDSSKLSLDGAYNTNTSMFPVASSGVYSNINSSSNQMKFNFLGIDETSKQGKYDFTNGGTLVTLVFTVKDGAAGNASVYLDVLELHSVDKNYVENSKVVTQGVTSSTYVKAEQIVTTAPTDPATEAPTQSPTQASKLVVNASSNLNSKVESIDVTGNTVTVKFNLSAKANIVDGQGVVTYDSTKLSLDPAYNTNASMFPVVSNSAVANLNLSSNSMSFNFTRIDELNKDGAYDFKNSNTLISLTFTVKSGASGTADVKLNVQELDSIDKSYVSNSVVTSDGAADVTSSITMTSDSTATTATNPQPTTPQPTQTVPPTNPTNPDIKYDYYVVGDSGLFGVEWVASPANGMTNINGIYYVTLENAPAGTFEYKVVSSDGKWYPSTLENCKITVPTDGSRVVFAFDPTKGYPIASADGSLPEYTQPTEAPTTAPATQAPTQPTTQAPTQAPTQKPTSAPATQGGQSVSKVTDTIAKTDTD